MCKEAGYDLDFVLSKDRAFINDVILSEDASIDKTTGRPLFISKRRAIASSPQSVYEIRRQRLRDKGVPEELHDQEIAKALAKLQALYDAANVKRKAM